MGAEMVLVAVGPRTTLGRLLDTQRALACAHRNMARPRAFKPRVESTRSALFRLNGAFLDWSPVIEHLPRILHAKRAVAIRPNDAGRGLIPALT
jgi:hypothetical protein